MKRIFAVFFAMCLSVCMVSSAYAIGFNLGGLSEIFGESAEEEIPSFEDSFTGDTVKVNINGIKVKVHRNFKDTMDKYEDFFDEYAALMTSPSPDMMQYATFLARYADMIDALDSLDETEMDEGDLAYYTYVMANISIKLSLAGE
ncbi:MAG: DUF6591 domain-containing protein [Christensenellales bacterium]